MKRSRAACALLFVLPLTGCDAPLEIEPRESSPASEAPALSDLRPPAGKKAPGYDLTELARKQNAPGQEPGLPTDKGTVTRARLVPQVEKTANGFVAHLPRANNVPSPAYHRGRVFTGGFGTHQLHSLDPKTGKPAWSLELSDDGPTAPACKDGVCVFNTYSCTIYSVAADTGKHLWSWWLGSPQLATPVIFGGVVYTSYPGQGAPDGAPFVIAAFDLKTGEPKWRRWIDAEVNSTPVAYAGKLYVATQVGSLYELSADEGKVLSVRHNRVASPPVITPDGTFFPRERMPAGNDMLAAAYPVLSPDPAIPVMASEVEPQPRPLVAAHRLVTVEEGVVVASHRKTGERLWQRRLDGGAAQMSAPIFYAGGSVLLASQQGKVTRIHEDTGDVMETYDLVQGGELASQPIVHDGWIYAGTSGGSLVGFDTGDPALTGWHMLGGGPARLNIAGGEES